MTNFRDRSYQMKLQKPDYIFESSWEVCNKVGGIYTVLASRAQTLQTMMPDHIIFIGPDCWGSKKSPYFVEDPSLFADWRTKAASEGLIVKTGRWDVPGNPIAILVEFTAFYKDKDKIYTKLWEKFGVDSLHAYGDYDEASMFSFAAARVVESFYNYYLSAADKVIYHGNEWMTGLGVLYIHDRLPQIGTLFTTHATSIGRSIAGNNKPLYEYFNCYNGDQMAAELNMQSKQSIEKQTAKYVDCFTTVSDITARECAQLLDKPVDVVLPNGFEDSFVPAKREFDKKRKAARQAIFRLANALTGDTFDDNTMIISTSGRYEYRNKGIDVFVESMNRLRNNSDLKKKVIAIIEVPAWVKEPRTDLVERLKENKVYTSALPNPVITHRLHEEDTDRVLGQLSWLGMHNEKSDAVKLIFVPCYLNGDDGLLNMPYYDLILGNDLCVYPSYYEPWGYTPLEAVAFKVPCITTDLAGFGLWANSVLGHDGELSDGVKVVHRTDTNYNEVADDISDAIAAYSALPATEVTKTRTAASRLSKKALWNKFIKYYEEAYSIALTKAAARKA